MACRGGEEKPRNMVSPSGYCYSDVSSTNPNIQSHDLVNQLQLQSFESNNPEIYNLTTGMEMIGFPPKSHDTDTNSAMWKGFFSKTSTHNSGGGGSGGGPGGFNKDDFTTGVLSDTTSENLMVAAESADWNSHNRLIVDDSSLRCVFPCEGNERPSQGLSLSLSSANPSTIGLQSFELRQQDDPRFVSSNSRSSDGLIFSKSMNIQQHQHLIQAGFLGKDANLDHHHPHHHQHGLFQIRNSKYLGPAQELLNEFCYLGTKQTDPKPKIKTHKTSQWQDENASSSSKKQSLLTLELVELQKRKTKLLSMLDEVDRRYRHYCDQMKAVVSSFEAVAGNGAAAVYSALASKAMSRHFRCLRDGIVGQIQATKKAMGEKDSNVAPGTTRGETPRLRLLDQNLRQQRAFQQMSMMETHPWRPQRGLPERSVSVLRAWLFEHFLHPYPSDVDKHILARQTGLSRSQVSNWFINARVRLWKPMVEEMYLEETKDEQDNINMASSSDDNNNNTGRHNQNPDHTRPGAAGDDHKPTPDQLVRIDSECLSSIINNNNNNPEKNDTSHTKNPPNQPPHHHLHHHHEHSFGRVADAFGATELDFSTYSHHAAGGGSGGVTLTLGLQQHGGGGGVSLAFSPPSQNSLFYGGRDHMEDCQPVQYSLLDGEGQNLPYRNLMGAQLLHDLAG